MFCLPDFTGMGVQRVVATLAQGWPHERAQLVLCVHERRGELLETLPPEVPVVALEDFGVNVPKLKVLARPFLHARAIGREKPDAVVSFVPGDNLSLLALPRRFALAVSEHIHVSSQLPDYRLRFRLPYRALFPRWYPRADAVVCIAEQSRDDLVQSFGIPRGKTVVLHNPIDLRAVRAGAAAQASFPFTEAGPVVIAAGRFDRQKRFDRLLGAIALARRELPVKLALLGDGALRGELERRARELGLERNVWFAGFEKNPWRFMARADVLALSSDYEGFPCVLAEGLALEVPVVATDCPSGPRELLDGGRAGLLVEELAEAPLAAALVLALRDREAAAARARHGLQIAERFGARAVAEQYLALCERLTRERA